MSVFCFLWDDPLFTGKPSIYEWELKDPEFIEFRRKYRLLSLELLYMDLHQSKQNAKSWRDTAGWYAWCLDHTLRQIKQHIPIRSQEEWLDLLEQAKVDSEVQKTLEFDFAAWLDENEIEEGRQQ